MFMVVMTQDERPDAQAAYKTDQALVRLKRGHIVHSKYSKSVHIVHTSQRIKRIPEPSSPAADRGSQIHDEAEQVCGWSYRRFS